MEQGRTPWLQWSCKSVERVFGHFRGQRHEAPDDHRESG